MYVGVDPAKEQRVQMKDNNGYEMFPNPSNLILGKFDILRAYNELAHEVYALKARVEELEGKNGSL